MNQQRPSSEPRAGLFVTIDGPSGVGKTTTITHVAQLLEADGVAPHLTLEPSRGPIGRLAYELTDTVTGPALACLYAADRYHHLQSEIRPVLQAGQLVLCDRYVPSALVMQRLDGLELDFLWNLNTLADRPHLAIILTADPSVITARLTTKGPHNRLQRQVDSSVAEARFYREASEHLGHSDYQMLPIDTTRLTPGLVAARIRLAIHRCLNRAPSIHTARDCSVGDASPRCGGGRESEEWA
ncbi:dTMP kinase [Kribbella qitaiheensis]|uniref:dTMP kinase n=1 Tax=Kribbella qitaiheensis TaxID=1544730 RepID=UPI00360FAA46